MYKYIIDCVAKEFYGDENVVIKRNVWGKTLATLGCGGCIDAVFYPKTVRSLIKIAEVAKNYGVKPFVLGNCSNIIISDKGYSGVAIKTDFLRGIYLDGNELTALSGTKNYELASFSLTNGISGLEFLCQIPGTVGGMTYMNAGAVGKDVSACLKSCRILTCGKIIGRERKDILFSYRKSGIDGIIISSTFIVEKSDVKDIYARMRRNAVIRGSQPKLNTCGSVFKNPCGMKIAEMLDKCGVKGLVYGGMKVSEKHANFIVNVGGGTSFDAVKLINEMKRRIFNEYNFVPETEICFLGDFK